MPFSDHNDFWAWYYKVVPPEYVQWIIEDTERRQREGIKSDPPERLSAPFKAKDWKSGIELFLRWGDKMSVRKAVLDFGLPIYFLNPAPNERLHRRLYWIDDPWAFAEMEPLRVSLEVPALEPQDEQDRAAVEAFVKHLNGHSDINFFFMLYNFDDVTFLEKLHPDVWENSLHHWLSVDELCKRWSIAHGELILKATAKEIPHYVLQKHCEVRRAPSGPFFYGNESIFKVSDIANIEKRENQRRESDKNMVINFAKKLRRKNPAISRNEIAKQAEKRLKGKFQHQYGRTKPKLTPRLRALKDWLEKAGF